MSSRPFSPRIFLLIGAADDLSLLPALVGAGVDGIQVRAKGLDDGEVLDLAAAILKLVRPLGATVVVNDRVDLALAAGADGVHLGRSDLPVAAARAIAPDLVIGATCRTRAQVLRAERDGADYAGFGPVFASSSKEGLPDPLGVAAVGEASGVLPLVAIGGIDAARARAVIEAGAHGVAVIGSVWCAPDPVAAAADLCRSLPLSV